MSIALNLDNIGKITVDNLLTYTVSDLERCRLPLGSLVVANIAGATRMSITLQYRIHLLASCLDEGQCQTNASSSVSFR